MEINFECKECGGIFDCDLIRQKDWDYSVSTFGVPESKREELRKEVIKQYGAKHELIAPADRIQKKSKKKKRKKKKAVRAANLSLHQYYFRRKFQTIKSMIQQI